MPKDKENAAVGRSPKRLLCSAALGFAVRPQELARHQADTRPPE